jgi:hypothetical protein
MIYNQELFKYWRSVLLVHPSIVKRTGSNNLLWRKGERHFAASRFKMQYKQDKDFYVYSRKYLPSNVIIFHKELPYRTYKAPNRH